MSTVTIVIEDNSENGSVRMVVTPPIAELVVRAHNGNFSSAEGLAMHLARRALEYQQRAKSGQLEQDSKLIIPTIVG